MRPFEQKIIDHLITEIKKSFSGESTGHDWYHIERVYRVSVHIALRENADLFLVKAGALLHDIADHKFCENYEEETEKRIRQLLEPFTLPEEIILKLISITGEISFKGANVPEAPSTIEAMIIQDADRLDALGAIGIARAFAYGGWKQNMIHDPGIIPVLHSSFDEYKKTKGTTINHFYEKLLLLRNRLFTDTARQLAEERHRFMEQYLEQFYVEWNACKGIEEDNL